MSSQSRTYLESGQAATLNGLTRDPVRLQALCQLWREGECSIWMTLRGSSMMPSIPPGSKVQISCHEGFPQPGSIIAYQRGEYLVVHRFIFLNSDNQMVCRGDANSFLDAPVLHGQCLGTVVDTALPNRWRRAALDVGHMLYALKRKVRTLKRRLIPIRASRGAK